MIEYKFKDFKGKWQTQFDELPGDKVEDFYKLVKYPKRVFVVNSNLNCFITLEYFKEIFGDYRIASLVNYADVKYTSLIIYKETDNGERYTA